VEHVEGAGIVALDLVVVAVAQEQAEFAESLGDIRIAHPVDDVDDLATLPRELELILLAIFRHIVVRNETHARQANVRQHVFHRVEMRMTVGLGAARAGRGTGSEEHNKCSECASLTGRSEATNRRSEMHWQEGRTPDFYTQLRPVAHPPLRQ
jgi:hypothetical protein